MLRSTSETAPFWYRTLREIPGLTDVCGDFAWLARASLPLSLRSARSSPSCPGGDQSRPGAPGPSVSPSPPRYGSPRCRTPSPWESFTASLDHHSYVQVRGAIVESLGRLAIRMGPCSSVADPSRGERLRPKRMTRANGNGIRAQRSLASGIPRAEASRDDRSEGRHTHLPADILSSTVQLGASSDASLRPLPPSNRADFGDASIRDLAPVAALGRCRNPPVARLQRDRRSLHRSPRHLQDRGRGPSAARCRSHPRSPR
jgi:hypothetical protein